MAVEDWTEMAKAGAAGGTEAGRTEAAKTEAGGTAPAAEVAHDQGVAPVRAAGGTAAGGTTTGESAAGEPARAAEAGPDQAAAIASAAAEQDLESGIVEALRTVYDPEIPVNIYEMGLVYDLHVGAGGQVQIKMTLTSPACPVAGSLPGEVKEKVEGVPGVASAEVEVVWDPVWNPSMMSEAARLQLGMF